ncbi:hypothetical protein BU16DRAFT_245647 [Lophium mytilinum]|uniref:Uncharacterized protein n=1 Tax=Lophium mytilinum TaxID=390894 RepID=A0A6A6R7N1_9PEZI|nr:hypothetical protein BU16DRAFT_245647 [Lophium mytilinum]
MVLDVDGSEGFSKRLMSPMLVSILIDVVPPSRIFMRMTHLVYVVMCNPISWVTAANAADIYNRIGI